MSKKLVTTWDIALKFGVDSGTVKKVMARNNIQPAKTYSNNKGYTRRLWGPDAIMAIAEHVRQRDESREKIRKAAEAVLEVTQEAIPVEPAHIEVHEPEPEVERTVTIPPELRIRGFGSRLDAIEQRLAKLTQLNEQILDALTAPEHAL